MFSPELKKGSTEMLILSLLEDRARHGYEIGRLIEARSGRRLAFALTANALSDPAAAREPRPDQGAVGGKGR